MEMVMNEPFGTGSMGNLDNPFQDAVSFDKVEPVRVLNPVLEGLSPGDILMKELAAAGANRVGNMARTLLDGVGDFISGIARTAINLVTQAVKMAVFKFAIEFCAMAIKNMVETMTKMSLSPPNIDTKGVFYNFGTAGTAPPASPINQNIPRYDNPFGDPFASRNSSAW